MKVTFVPEEKAGVIIMAMAGALEQPSTARSRLSTFNKLAMTLRTLKLIDSEKVSFVATGCVGRDYGLLIGQFEVNGSGFHTVAGDVHG